jgi:multisubunit Na+/H+ antiporter MnhB subunit
VHPGSLVTSSVIINTGLMGATGWIASPFYLSLSTQPEYGGEMNRTNAAYWAFIGLVFDLFALLTYWFPKFPEMLLLGLSGFCIFMQVGYLAES